MQEYHRGQVLKFGPQCVSQQGLQLAQQQALLHWSEIKYIDCIQDVLTLQQKEHLEDWATVALSSLPNVCILEAMIRHLHRLHKAMAASGQACLPVQAQHQNSAGHADMSQRQDGMERIGDNCSLIRDRIAKSRIAPGSRM